MKQTITIGMDLGDKKHQVCVLDDGGRVVQQHEITNTRAAIETFFGQYHGAVVAMETGTHSPWVSQAAQAAGLQTLVGNTRKLRAIWMSRQKSDVRDAEMLARIARFDPQLLYPIRHRNAQAGADLVLIKARDQWVRTRTNLINHLRGLVKSHGERLSRCSSAAFARKVQLPPTLKAALEPMQAVIASAIGP